MFADLAKYRSKDFWQAHKTVWFDTELGSCAYEIFAVIRTTVQADADDAFPFYWFVDAAAPEGFCRLCVSLQGTGVVRYRYFSPIR